MHHVYTIGHLFSGCGGSAIGASAATARMAGHTASLVTLGGTDVDVLACQDFEALTGVPALCADMHNMQPSDLIRAWGRKAPDVVMASPPCKGFSGLLSAKRAELPKYQDMNMLLLKSLMLLCSTWSKPPKIIFFENVPRIQARGAHVIAAAHSILSAHNFEVGVGNHDCGEIGGLAQHRRRWFMLARHRDAVPRHVYHVKRRRVLACGEVLASLPMPGDVDEGGPMHAVPNVSWRNWLRLAAIPAGGDWRDLPGVVAQGKTKREYFRRNAVAAWDGPLRTVTGPGGSAAEAVADPRVAGWLRTGMTSSTRESNWQRAYGVTSWNAPAPTVTSRAKIHAGAYQVADPRVRLALTCSPRAGAYKVMSWTEAASCITSSLRIDNGAAAIADPRVALLRSDLHADIAGLSPDRPPPFTPVLISDDGTWHRPLTTFELAMLQSFPHRINGRPIQLAGTSHSRWREAIGNAVPPAAAEAVAGQLLTALLCGTLDLPTFVTGPVWAGQLDDGRIVV